MDTGKRRSRTTRMPTGKRLALSPRDLAIFRVLTQYRYLRSTYIHAFVGGKSEKRLKERLGDLFHEGYIGRPEQQWQYADARCTPFVYELAEQGRRVLAQTENADGQERTYLSAKAHRQFAHSVLICDCLASIELAARERAGLRFIPWGEILARAPEATQVSAVPFRIPAPAGGVIPDGLFGLEYLRDEKKSYRFFALEVDRGTMPVARTNAAQSSMTGKLQSYADIVANGMQKAHWGISTLLVLTITPSEARMVSMLGALPDRLDERMFLFRPLDATRSVRPVLALLEDTWQRTDGSEICIDGR